jgi:hypothetical protein
VETEGGGHSVSQYVWFFTVKDDLVFRVLAARSESEARGIYEREGLTLGI